MAWIDPYPKQSLELDQLLQRMVQDSESAMVAVSVHALEIERG